MLELVWHPDAVAFAFSRDGSTDGEDQLDVLGDSYRGRFVATDELARWEPDEPLGDSAQAVLHVRELARRAVSEGLVFPQAAEIGGEWFAFWGATLEAEIEQTLTRIAAASPPVIADYFHGDRVATVNDLYPRLVDQIARDRLVTPASGSGRRGRSGATVRSRPSCTASRRPSRSCRTAARTARSRRR